MWGIGISGVQGWGVRGLWGSGYGGSGLMGFGAFGFGGLCLFSIVTADNGEGFGFWGPRSLEILIFIHIINYKLSYLDTLIQSSSFIS